MTEQERENIERQEANEYLFAENLSDTARVRDALSEMSDEDINLISLCVKTAEGIPFKLNRVAQIVEIGNLVAERVAKYCEPTVYEVTDRVNWLREHGDNDPELRSY